MEHLLDNGYQVKALSLYNSFGRNGWLDTIDFQNNENLEIVHGDICDAALMSSLISDCDVVFHLAALIAIPYSYDAVESYINVNIKGTMNVMEAVKKHNVSRLLVISSSEVYGTALEVPITEEHPLQGQSPYSATKIGAEKLAQSYHLSYELPLTVVRPFNTYGPRQSVRAVIPSLMMQISGGADTIQMGNTKPTRDLVFVKDTAEGMRRIAECDAAIGEVVNIATNNEIAVGDLAHTIAGLLGKTITITQDEQRMRPEGSEVYRLLGSAEKLQKLTGWKPGTSLEDGLKVTLDWFSKPENSAHYPQNFLK